ncbi:maleylpyruvate isomerase family mycothiol-dependent enzyme [Candidatus Frankia alpina]|uniref:maleylpyruvate isomerase family mycothiol-dependent enzyme n=1 Tax=Candidatus Frankia alpina TaxID=2699483 RepID=UPI0013D7BEE8|nr:maleylpyruvate isomerase family mycothiol-dependent enzyme [Candidatus Frankia alpina]
MPSRIRRRDAAAALAELVAAVVPQWGRVADAVGELPAGRLAAPSPLPGWTVGDLAMHVGWSATALTQALAPAESLPATDPTHPAVPRAVSAAGYLTGTGARAESIADTARALAAAIGPAGLRERLAAEVSAAAAALARVTDDGDPVVATPGGPMLLTEFLRTRAVEAVVHGLDLGVEPLRPALKVAAKLFAELFAHRVPGHTVELRVPPFAAVQVVEGPRHTRGTPPNVVEAGPVAFVLLCAGRLAWGDAVADGRISASGERADLSGYLPLL